MSKILKLLIAATLVLALSFSLFSCGSGDATPSAKSFENAYDEKIDVMMDSIGNYYDLIGNYDPSNMRVDATLSVDLSKDLLPILRSYTSYDLKWVNDLEIQLSENIKGEIMSAALGLNYKNSEVLAMQSIMNFAKSEMLFAIPALNEKFAKLSMDYGDFGGEDMMASFEQMMSIDITSLLPDEALIESILKDTVSTFMSSVELEFTEEELVVNGVKQSCVAYEVSFSEKDLTKAAIDVLKMLQTSKDVKTLICDFIKEFNKVAGDMGSQEMGSSVMVYQYLTSAIGYVIEEMEEELYYCEDDTILVWTSYITGELDIIGMQLDVMMDERVATLYMATAQDGDDVGVEMYFKRGREKVFAIYGELVDDGSEISGTYELIADGASMVYITLENVDADELEDGYFIGSVSISPSKGLLEMLRYDDSVVGLALSAFALKIDVEENSEDECKLTVSLMNGSAPYASITMEAEISSGDTVKIPSNTVDAEDWVRDIDFDKLIDAIEDSGLPSDVTDIIESYFYNDDYR